MAKDKTAKLERAKKTTKGKKPSSARAAAPPGWIQGDFLPSTVTEEDVLNLVTDGLVAAGSWRLPGTEAEPEPREGERVLLTTHLERGFSLPPHPFFRSFLNFFGAQLHHFPPNSIAYLAAFVTMCECFLGCPPHWGLFKHIFTIRSQSVKKAQSSDSRTNVIQLCGGLGLQKRTGSAFPALTFPDSVRGWQSTWFYCNDVASPNMSTGLPPFTLDRPTVPKSLIVTEEEKANVGILMNGVVNLIRGGVTGLDLLEVFLGRRIQPLQARDHPMWHYSGVDDTTRTDPEDVSEETVAQWLRSITGARDNPQGSKRVLPFSAENPPKVVSQVIVDCFYILSSDWVFN
jgi:hypothetical protein